MNHTLVEQLIGTANEFYLRGWLLATAGNLSVRVQDDPLRYAITASGGHKGRLTPGDFVAFSLGMNAPSSPRKPSAETVVHDWLYAHLRCGSIQHIHGPAVTLVSRHWQAAGHVDVSGFEYVKALGFWERDANVRIPIVPNHHDLSELADAVVQAATGVPAVLVAGHGVYAWGTDVAEAQRHIEATEFLCRMAWEEAKAGIRTIPR